MRGARHSRNHPFFEKWARGERTAGQTAMDRVRRWRYMNGIYWYALHGRDDDTPTGA